MKMILSLELQQALPAHGRLFWWAKANISLIGQFRQKKDLLEKPRFNCEPGDAKKRTSPIHTLPKVSCLCGES